MPTINANFKDLENLIGKTLSRDIDRLNDIFSYVKGEVDSLEEDDLTIEIKDSNHPDIWSIEGIARALRGFLEIEIGLKTYQVKGSLKLTSDEKLVAYRLGRTFHHFGYDSSAEILDTSAGTTSTATVNGNKTTTKSTIPTLNVSMSRPVDTSSNSFTGIGVSRPLGDREFPIESEIDDLAVNVPVVIQASYWEPPAFLISDLQWQPAQSIGVSEPIKVLTQQKQQAMIPIMPDIWQWPPEKVFSIKEQVQALLGRCTPLQTTVRTITDIRTITMTWGSSSGTVSQLTLNSDLSSSVGADSWMKMAEAQFHEVMTPPDISVNWTLLATQGVWLSHSKPAVAANGCKSFSITLVPCRHSLVLSS